MKTIKLYQVNCNLWFNNEEEIPDFTPNIKDLFVFTPSLEKAIGIYESIKCSEFDKKEVIKAEIKGFGNTYTKYILVVEMPLELYNSCTFEDNGEKCTEEKRLEYINEMVWHEDVNWKIDNLLDVLFDIDWLKMEFENLRNFKLKTA